MANEETITCEVCGHNNYIDFEAIPSDWCALVCEECGEEVLAREDHTNNEILQSRMNQYNKIAGPRVGDWVIESDGSMTRITDDFDTGSVLTGGCKYGQYHLGAGYISYSGSIGSNIKKESLVPVDGVKSGAVWFFKGDRPAAGNGIDYMVDFRIYKVIV